MDPLSFGFLGLVLVMGGVVAFLADGLGRKIGKTRRTLGPLRPRHTATLLTVCAGVLIPLLTVGALALASQDFRQWVTEGRKAIAEVGGLQRMLVELNRDIANKTNTAAEFDRQLKISEEKFGRLEVQTKASQAQLKTAQEQVRATQKKTDQLNLQVLRVSATLKESSTKLETARLMLSNLQKASNDLQRSYKLAQQDLRDAYDQNKQITDQNESLTVQNRELVLNAEKLRQEMLRLQAEQSQLNESIEKARAELGSAQDEILRVLRELDDKNSRLAKANSDLNSTLNTSRMQPMIYKVGEEVARVQLRAGLLPAEALAAVRKLQADASFLAGQRGAQSPTGGPAAGLFPFKQDDGRIVTIEEQEQAIAEALRNNGNDIVLVAYSSLNTFVGEYVALVLRPYRNPIVYRQAEVVAEGRIDGSMAEHTILDKLSTYLETIVRQAASKKGMIPIAGSEGGLGAVTSEQMFSLVRQISEVGRTVRVVAIAANDTRAADQLRLEFKLK